MNQSQPSSPLGQIKARARFVSLHSLWVLIGALAIQYTLEFLFSFVLSLADFSVFGTATEITVLGLHFSVTYEIANVLTQLVLAPLCLGVVSFIQSQARGLSTGFLQIFSWLGDVKKRRVSLAFALWRILFLGLTLPIRVIPMQYLSNQLSLYMESFSSSRSFELYTVELVTREVYMALLVLLIYGFLSLPFMALPYVLADQSRFGFWKCFCWSTRIMINHIPHYLLLLVSFIPWILASSCVVFLLIFVAVYYQVSLSIFIDSIRRGEILSTLESEEQK